MNSYEQALALVEDIRNALTAGTEHYDIHGKPLTTVEEVIEALNRDEEVECRVKIVEPEIIKGVDRLQRTVRRLKEHLKSERKNRVITTD